MDVKVRVTEKALRDLQAIAIAVPLGARGGAKNAMIRVRDEAANLVQVRTGNLQSRIRGASVVVTSRGDQGSRISFRSNVPYDYYVNQRYRHYPRAVENLRGSVVEEIREGVKEAIDNVQGRRY
jgi:hypothetical protein